MDFYVAIDSYAVNSHFQVPIPKHAKQMLCQLWWNMHSAHIPAYSQMHIYNKKSFFPMGIGVTPIPIYVHSHSQGESYFHFQCHLYFSVM